jgi:signal transduction histidine kinase
VQHIPSKLRQAVDEQLAALRDLAGSRAGTPALQRLRERVSHFYAVLLWLHVPVVAAIAYSNQVPVWSAALVMAVAALLSTIVVAWFGGVLVSRLTIAAALTMVPALMVYAGAGPWQVDWHMYFFVIFGLLAVYVDWRPLALAAGITAGHDLLLGLLFPGAVFPDPGLGRVTLHAGIVIVDCLVLFWTASQMLRLFLESAASVTAAEAGTVEARRLESYTKQGADLILHAAGQGLLQCDSACRIQPHYSAELEKIFETDELAGRDFVDLLEGLLAPKLLHTATDFVALLFDASKKERTVLRVNPLAAVECSFWDQTGRSFVSKVLCFSFRRIVEEGRVVRLFVAVSDITSRIALERRLNEADERKERQVALMLSIMPMDPSTLIEFIALAKEEIGAMQDAVRPQDFADAGPAHRTLLDERLYAMLRRIQNIRGNASLIGFEYFRRRAETFETKLAGLRARSMVGGDDYLAVMAEYTGLQSDVEELEMLRDRFATARLRSAASERKGTAEPSDEVVVAIAEFAKTVAAKLGKEIRLDVDGFDTRALNGMQRRAVKDALIQLTLNSLTHGIEPPHVRARAGKDPRATLSIRPACDKHGKFGLIFRDDGRGFEVEPAGEAGQGVGLTIVKQRIVEECHGDIVVRSEPGCSCEFELNFPVTGRAIA